MKKLPIGVAAASLGAATLSNVYARFGFTAFRHACMLWLGTSLALFIAKIILHFSQVKSDYANPLLAPIYSIILMGGMLFASWLRDFSFASAALLFWVSLCLYIILMLAFAARHVFHSFSWQSFTPAYYVPTLGLLVSTVSGAAFLPVFIAKAFIYFGIGLYLFMLVLLVYRFAAHPYAEGAVHTKTILIAPVSLSIISLVNYKEAFNPGYFLVFLYILLMLSFAYVLLHLFIFFTPSFTPGFAGLTFPMAIATLASLQAAGYFNEIGLKGLGFFAQNMAGFQVFLSSCFIGFVLFNFLRIYFKK